MVNFFHSLYYSDYVWHTKVIKDSLSPVISCVFSFSFTFILCYICLFDILIDQGVLSRFSDSKNVIGILFTTVVLASVHNYFRDRHNSIIDEFERGPKSVRTQAHLINGIINTALLFYLFVYVVR